MSFLRHALAAVAALCLLSVPAAAANDRPLIYGMNPMPAEWSGHNGDQSWWEPLQYDKMKAAGCASVRVGVGWDLVEPNPGDRLWGDIDNDLKLMLDRGFEPVLLIVATPTWALLPGQGTPFYPPQMQYREAFERFVYDCARKFRGRVKYYEFWNEPNGYGWNRDPGGNTFSKAEEYVPWLIHGCNAIKKGDPNALWSIGGLDDNSGYGDYYVDKCYKYMARGYFDAVCEHPYSASTADLWKLADIRTVMANYGDALPIWITEMGWPANGRESTVASWITDYFNRLSADSYNYCTIATYHTSTDFTAEPVGYGLMTYDLATKVTYNAFRDFPKPSRASLTGTPAAVKLNPARVRIDFSTDRPATAQVMYGATNGYGMVTARETVESTSHSITIDGLLPDTTYQYRIRMGQGEYADNFSLNYWFKTSAGPVVGLVGSVSVTGVSADSATISWTTDVPADTKLEYGIGYDYQMSVSDSVLSTSHSATLTGLSPNTAYQARIVSNAPGFANLVREIDPIVTKRAPGELANGGFESFGPRQPWVIYGKMDGRVTGTWFAGFTARTGGAFFGSAASWGAKSGGCYQEVGAVPGRLYGVRGWTRSYQIGGTPGDDAARLGIDRAGGTDAYSSSIDWGQWVYSETEWAPMECWAVAESDTITVYADIRQPYSREWNINAVDDIELIEYPDFISVSGARQSAPGERIAVGGAVCTANFGDHIYVQAPDRASGLRVNTACSAQPGDVVRFGGVSGFTGPQKSVDADVTLVDSPGEPLDPVAVLARSVGGAPLPGQSDVILGAAGVNNLNCLVKVCGRVAHSEAGFYYVDDGSGSADGSGWPGIRVIVPGGASGPPTGAMASAWGVAAAQQIGGHWAPVIRQVSPSDFSVH